MTIDQIRVWRPITEKPIFQNHVDAFTRTVDVWVKLGESVINAMYFTDPAKFVDCNSSEEIPNGEGWAYMKQEDDDFFRLKK